MAAYDFLHFGDACVLLQYAKYRCVFLLSAYCTVHLNWDFGNMIIDFE